MKIAQIIIISSVIMLGTNAFAACYDSQKASMLDQVNQQIFALSANNPQGTNELIRGYQKEVLPALRGSLGNGGSFENTDTVCNTLQRWIQKTQ